MSEASNSSSNPRSQINGSESALASSAQEPASASVFSFKQFLGVYLRGIAMGAADVVPGVSGGTIAFITGIYTRLIQALGSVDKKLISMLLSLNIVGAFRHVDGVFLLSLFAGIGTAIFSLAHLIDYLLQNFPIMVWATFFGLILASAVTLLMQQGKPSFLSACFFLIGIAVILGVASLSVTSVSPSLLVVFLAGMIAISAMLLPGLSGSFLLLMFGLYQPMLEAVKTFDVAFILSFATGAICGLLLFSRLIRWLLNRHYSNTLMLLIGMLFGSLYAVWPWSLFETVESISAVPVMPSTFAATGADAMIWQALLCALLAAAVVFGFDYVGKRYSNRDA